MQPQANPTLVAVMQLAQFVIIVTAVVVLVIEKSLPSGVASTLAAYAIAHSGIIAYNGATKTGGNSG